MHAIGMEAAHMHKKNKRSSCRKIVLKLPDLDHAKSAILNSLISPHSRRNYKFTMEQFITWYCSEPRLALNRTVVLGFRFYLESPGLADGTVNQRLAAVRRLAYEAADSGFAQSGARRRDSPGQKRKAAESPHRKLVDPGSSSTLTAESRR